jgi:hypothetical protein
MVNLPALVHRPQSRSMMDLVHLLLPRAWFTCTTWSWSELLGGAARDVVGEVVVGAARRSYSECGRRGRGRSCSVELLRTWSARSWSWLELGDGKIPFSSPMGLPPAVRSLTSSRGGASF